MESITTEIKLCKSLYYKVIKSRRLRWAGHVARMEEGRSTLKILTSSPIGKRSLGRARRRWKDDIRKKKSLKNGINTRNWIDSAQDRDYWRVLVNNALNPGFHKPLS